MFHTIYQRNSKDDALKTILDRFVGYLSVLFYATQAVYASSVASISVLPLLISLFYGTPFYSLDLHFPLADKDTPLGFILHYTFFCVGSYFWTPTLIASDVLYFSQLILAYGHIEVMIKLLDDINGKISEGRHDQATAPATNHEVTERLKRVCFEHQEHLQ